MNFLAPFFLAFSVLAAIPVVIHLYGRSRAKVQPFAAMDFLLSGHRKVAQRTKLRQILLLILRAAVMAAVPLCLAKPFFETLSDLPSQISQAQSAVLVIDDSLAMGYRLGNSTLLAKARSRAQRLLDALPAGAEAAVVLSGRGSQAPQQELTGDRARLSRAIASITQTYRPVDMQGAVRRAAQILASGRGGRRIYILSSLSSRAIDSSLSPPPDIEVVPVDVADEEPLPNRAIAELHVDPAPGLGPTGVRIAAEVVNHGEEAVKDLPVTLWIDGKAVARGLLDLPGRGRALKRFFHALSRPQPGERNLEREREKDREPAPAGVHDISVQLKNDALPADDTRHLRVEIQRRLHVLVVNGDQRNLRRDDEAFYLEVALHPGDPDDAPIETTTVSIEDLGGRRLSDFDMVILANAKAQEVKRAHLDESLLSYVQGGGGLFIALGENVDADAYNGNLQALLPQPLSGSKTVGPLARKGEPDPEEPTEVSQSGRGERIARIDRRHPLLQPFLSERAAESLQEARFNRYMLLRPTPAVPRGSTPLPPGQGNAPTPVRVLAGLESGAPLLVEKSLGAGRVILFCSTVDRDWNDLPIQPAFLPLMQQLVRYLSRAQMREPEPPALIGQRHEIKLRADDRRVEVTLPSSQKRLFEQERLTGRRLLPFTETDEPGLYQVAAAGDDRVLRVRAAESFVVNVDPAESDLRRAPPARILALSRPLADRASGPSPKRRVELWHALGAILLLLLAGEAFLLREK